MEERNIINEEIMDVAEDIVPNGGSGIGGKLIGGALIAGVVFVGYKLFKKFKSNKEDDHYVQVNDCVQDGDEEVIDAEVVEKLNRKMND